MRNIVNRVLAGFVALCLFAGIGPANILAAETGWGISVSGGSTSVDSSTTTVDDEAGEVSASTISGVRIEESESGDYGGIYVDSGVEEINIGGDADVFEAPDGEMYNVIIDIGDDQLDAARAGENDNYNTTAEFTTGSAIQTAADTTTIKNTYASIRGYGRPALYMRTPDQTVVVEDSTLITYGMDDYYDICLTFSANLTLGGRTTAIAAQGSDSYFFNSSLVAHDWGVIGLDGYNYQDVYLVNSDIQVANSGYGIIAIGQTRDGAEDETNPVYSYGTQVESATYGVIMHDGGEFNAYSMEDLPDEVAAVYSGDLNDADFVTEDGETRIAGVISALAAYCDMNAKPGIYNNMSINGGTLTTVLDYGEGEEIADTLELAKQDLDKGKVYAPPTEFMDPDAPYWMNWPGYYMNSYAQGATIWMRSSNANIDLDDVTLESSSGVIVQTTLDPINVITGGQCMVEDTVADEDVYGINITMDNMRATGDIVHNDYQRALRVNLGADSSLSGEINYTTAAQWQDVVSDFVDDLNAGDETLSAWVADGTIDADNVKAQLGYAYGLYGFEQYGDEGVYNCTGGISVDGSRGLGLTLESGAVWTVTGDSTLTALTIEDGAALQAPAGYSLVMTVGGEETAIAAGTYTGEISITLIQDGDTPGNGSGGGSTTAPDGDANLDETPDEETGVTETLDDGTVVTTVTDEETGAVTLIVESVDGTVTEVNISASGAVTAEITLPAGVSATTVRIPLENLSSGTVAIAVYSDGTEEIIKYSVAEDGSLYIPVDGDVQIRIVDNSKTFTDADDARWATDAIAFVTARELFLGTSDTEFSPNTSMTRAMLATVLYRLEGEPEAGENPFDDVDEGKYYTDAVAWAAAEGIVDGVGDNTFAPNEEITREQLAAMLYRYVGSPTVTGNFDQFDDAEDVSSWAEAAMQWAVESGVIQGKTDTTIEPVEDATRAEVSTMLQRFVTGVTVA